MTVSDPASGSYPGWTVRNIITALHASFPDLVPGLRLLCLRNKVRNGQLSVGGSLVLTLTTSGDTHGVTTAMPGVVGWEKNDKGQLGPQLANMRASMGAAPHTIRGSLSGFTQFTAAGPAFSQCNGYTP